MADHDLFIFMNYSIKMTKFSEISVNILETPDIPTTNGRKLQFCLNT
jgi:hypothetical protein